MLRRKFTETLLEWKNTPGKNCLLVKGARQVGKTFIIDDFAKKNYKNYVYINFELSKNRRDIFDGDLDIDSLIIRLSANYRNVKLESGNTIIFLDEIQSCPNARVALKSFSMDGRFDVIASGSLLGLNYKEVSSYPVGYETPVELHPLDFEEFLWAMGIGEDVIAYVSDAVRNKKKLDDSVMKRMDEYYVFYASVGGMPAVVNKFVGTNDFSEVYAAQKGIVDEYMNDVSKYAAGSEKPKIKNVFRSIPAQLAKDNKKFQYSRIYGYEQGEGTRTYSNSLLWLHDANIVSFCHNLQEPSAPLASNVIPDSFKVYMRDTGLLMSMLEEGVLVSFLKGDVKVNKGGIAENLTADVLTKKGIPLTYFEKRGILETDFVVNTDGTVTALEVKSGNNKRSKSLSSVISRHGVERGIKLERTNIHVDAESIEHYPLFAAAFLFPPVDLKVPPRRPV